MNANDRDYSELETAVNSMKIQGFTYLEDGWADFKGKEIDLTATEANHLAIAYTTLKQFTVCPEGICDGSGWTAEGEFDNVTRKRCLCNLKEEE